MTSWTFYFTALPLAVAAIVLSYYVASAITSDHALIFGATVAVATAAGYIVGVLDGLGRRKSD